MENFKEIRWKQRFENYKRAFELLERTVEINNPSEAEKGGLIQFYEMAFELAWKTLKDYLENQGIITKLPRDVIKKAWQSDIIDNGHLWIEALEDRNLTSHTYNEETANKVVKKIKESYFFLLQQLNNFLLSEE